MWHTSQDFRFNTRLMRVDVEKEWTAIWEYGGGSPRCEKSQSVSQSVLVNSTLFGESSIRVYVRLRARVGPGPFWVVVWVHMEGRDCSQHQQGLFFFRSLRFPLGRCPAKWAWAAVEDKSPIEGYFLIRGFSSRMPQLTSPEQNHMPANALVQVI